jgi:RHH-type proline utilization regulon transcriptional repressor/proline dehydrogenase/delta 1-pyrroline-5-carboxylate dehydrogenase
MAVSESIQSPLVDEREQRVLQQGTRLLSKVTKSRGLRERWFEHWFDRIMNDEAVRVQALRFVDVLPALTDDHDVIRHLREYFHPIAGRLPAPIAWALQYPLGHARSTAALIRKLLVLASSRYIAGANHREALKVIKTLRQQGIGFSLDMLGEAVLSEREADSYRQRYQALIDKFPVILQRWSSISALDLIDGQPGPLLYLSLKLTSLYSQINHLDPRRSMAGIAERLRPLLRAAKQNGVSICVDMEQYDYREIVIGAVKQLLMEPELRDFRFAGIAIQAYLKDSEETIGDLISWAKQRGAPVTIRLVRGAYWDYETVIARQNGWRSPVWEQKWQTDACYERCLELLFNGYPAIYPAVATHNPRSLAVAMTLAEEFGFTSDQFEFQMLYGMAEPLQRAVAELGYRLRVYLPCGEPIPGMAYLVRRLLENASSQSFQRLERLQRLPAETVLAPPQAPPESAVTMHEAQDPTTFRNEPPYRFTDERERQRFGDVVAQVGRRLGGRYPIILNGKEVNTGAYIESINPARPDVVVGSVAAADQALADAAVEGAAAAFKAWSVKPWEERAEILSKAADRLRRQRVEFAALEIFEAGKTWGEADANVTEAIDYLDYYAQIARTLGSPQTRHVAGEENWLWHRPRGVGVILPPWNFPLAILVGMLSAAIVTGNTALLKPSSQTPVIAACFVRLLQEAGLPPGVVQFLPGSGASVGDYLVRHPGVHFIAFTGSREVGLRIVRHAAEVPPGQRHVKYVIAEMGGKNAIIVDSDADPDEAIMGIVHSAFGYQGQKCSACSRVIVVGNHYEQLLSRLVEATNSLRIGDPEDPGMFMGPVIERSARERILKAVEAARSYAELALQVDCSGLATGYFVGPAIFSHVPPDSPLAQQEIFGPVLAVMQARSLDEALRIANDTDYALTGGFYSRSPANIDRVKREFQVGNLYVNRKITGALVDRQPFGGFKLSGLGSKAGGGDYLRHFLIPRTFTEKTLRRGFAPLEQTGELTRKGI